MLTLLGALLGGLTVPRSAFAEPTTTRAVLELEVNSTRFGDTVVLISQNDVLVPALALEHAGVIKLKSKRIRYQGVDYYSLRQSNPLLRFHLNEVDLVLEVVAPPSALASATLDLSEPAPPGIWYSEDPSVYLTYAPSLVDISTFRTFAEAGVTRGPLRATTSASYELRGATSRLMSQAVWSDRRNIREVIAGDSYVSTGPLGGSVLLGGLGIYRNFELDPYFVRIPRLGYRGSVMAPSTVDVYVNDVLVRRASLAPGEFDLKGVAPASGAGNVRYVVRDPLSRQSDIVMSYYATSAALAPGLSEYSYAAGFEREHYGLRSFDYGRPLLLGRYRVGLTPQLTTGFRAELGRTRVSGGTELVLAGMAGQLELASAVSIDRQQTLARGAAGLAGYSYNRGRVSLRFVLKATSPTYTTMSLGPESDRDLVEQSTSVGISIGRSTNVSAQIGFARSRDAGDHARGSVVFNQQIAKTVFGQVIASRDDRHFGISVYEAFATLSVQLPDNHTASLSGFVSGSHAESTVSVNHPIIGRTGVGYQGSATLAAQPRATATLQGQNRYVRADASYFYDSQGSHTLVDASGSVVWMKDAGLFFSRPIYGSFAVVEVPKSQGVTGYLNNQPVGRTNADGVLFIPDLQAYYGNRVHVDTADLPDDWQVDDGEVMVAPPPHGGARLVFESRRLRAVRGRLIPRGLDLEGIRYGELSVRVRGQTYTSPIGHNGEFELEGMPSGDWPAEARGETGYCTCRVPVPVDGKPIEWIGVVECAAQEASP